MNSNSHKIHLFVWMGVIYYGGIKIRYIIRLRRSKWKDQLMIPCYGMWRGALQLHACLQTKGFELLCELNFIDLIPNEPLLYPLAISCIFKKTIEH